MLRIISAGALAALAVFSFALPAGAQEATDSTPPVPVPQDSLQQALARYQSLDARVSQIQEQAMEANPELQQEQATIQADIEAAVFEAHPELKVALEQRLPEMQQEAAAAQAAQDTTRLQALTSEYQTLMGRMEDAQTEVVEEEAMRARLTDFQNRVMAAMVELDPEIQGVFDELRTLAGRLDATLGG